MQDLLTQTVEDLIQLKEETKKVEKVSEIEDKINTITM